MESKSRTRVKYIVSLTKEERCSLVSIVKKGKSAARKILHAQVLLKIDSGEHGAHDTAQQIADSLPIALSTVSDIRRRFVEEGLESALNRKKHSKTKPRIFDGEKEAKLIALCCSAPPTGHSRWSIRLLAKEVVRLEIVEEVGREAIRQTLKKMNLSLG